MFNELVQMYQNWVANLHNVAAIQKAEIELRRQERYADYVRRIDDVNKLMWETHVKYNTPYKPAAYPDIEEFM